MKGPALEETKFLNKAAHIKPKKVIQEHLKQAQELILRAKVLKWQVTDFN